MKRSIKIIVLGILVFVLFLFFQAQGNYNGDSGDLVVAAYQFGVPHPPGYPLYTLLAWLFTHIPIYTVAWRVGLLSNISHSLTVCFVFASVYALTKNKTAAFISTLLLISNYVFFLYAITAEVFGLFSLFVSALIFVLIQWIKSKRLIYWYVSIFIFGLSLTHHHVILFFGPAIFYLWWKNRRVFTFQMYGVSFFLFAIGLLPYSYIPFAARGNAIINWNHADTLSDFIKLVTRAYYGTFQSGGSYGESLYQRYLQVKAFIQFYIKDVGILGVALAVFGLKLLYQQKVLFRFFLIAFISIGPFFLFYASFPLLGYFSLATYERFLLPSYILCSLFAGVGIHRVLKCSFPAINNILSPVAQKVCITACILLVVGFQLAKTFFQFSGFAADKTADLLGNDYLQSIAPKGLLLLSFDTSLFTTQYMRYAAHVRPDIVVLHADRLTQPEYKKAIQKRFPTIANPSVDKATKIAEFIEANILMPIYSNTRLPVSNVYVWVPYGLVFKLEAAEKITDLTPIIDENNRLWSVYQNPNSGVLAHHNHMMLADIPNIYARARIEYGKILLKAEKITLAKEQFSEAVKLQGDSTIAEALKELAFTQLLLKECTNVFLTFETLRAYEPFVPVETYYYESIAYRECNQDEIKAKASLELYKQKKEKIQTPLSSF